MPDNLVFAVRKDNGIYERPKLDPLSPSFRVEGAPENDVKLSGVKGGSHREIRVITDIEEIGEHFLDGPVSNPPVSPEESTSSISNQVLRPQFEEVLYFVQAFPKLLATLSGALEQVIGVAVFGSDDCRLDRSVVKLVHDDLPWKYHALYPWIGVTLGERWSFLTCELVTMAKTAFLLGRNGMPKLLFYDTYMSTMESK